MAEMVQGIFSQSKKVEEIQKNRTEGEEGGERNHQPMLEACMAAALLITSSEF